MPEDEESENAVYDEEGREDMVDDDGMTPQEEGFMSGYEKEAEGSEKKTKKKEKEEDEEKEKEPEKEDEE